MPQGPQIRRTVRDRIMPSVPNRQIGRRGGLQDQAKGERAIAPLDQRLPEADVKVARRHQCRVQNWAVAEIMKTSPPMALREEKSLSHLPVKLKGTCPAWVCQVMAGPTPKLCALKGPSTAPRPLSLPSWSITLPVTPISHSCRAPK